MTPRVYEQEEERLNPKKKRKKKVVAVVDEVRHSPKAFRCYVCSVKELWS